MIKNTHPFLVIAVIVVRSVRQNNKLAFCILLRSLSVVMMGTDGQNELVLNFHKEVHIMSMSNVLL